MHDRKVLIAIFSSVLFIALVKLHVSSNYESSDGMMTETLSPIIKDGERISRRPDGTIKTIINYDHGIKNGDAALYYDDGQTIMLLMKYRNGKRNGTSIKYYKTGDVYAKTSYRNDVMHGPRQTFYRNGNPRSEITYGYGVPGTGLREYLKDGKEKQLREIVTHKSGDRLYLNISPSLKGEPKYYIGDLIDDQFFDVKNPDHISIKSQNDGYWIDLKVYTPSYLAMRDIICRYQTTQGNPLILKTRVNLE